MVTVPAVTPVTIPDEEPTLALALLAVHTPPARVLVSAVLRPSQTVSVPLIVPGAAFTVTPAVTEQPVGMVYVTVVEPAPAPNKLPEDEPMVATVVLPLSHVPPVSASVRVEDKPWHILVVPIIAVGVGLTVTIAVILQPVPMVYVSNAVPAVAPVTVTLLPAATIVALLLLMAHVPPAVASLRTMGEPTQTAGVPRIAVGRGLTVTTAAAVQPVLLSVNVILVVPASNADTTPVVRPTVPTAVLLLLQVPAPVASLSVIAEPWQTTVVPEIADGVAITVTAVVAVQPPLLYVIEDVPVVAPPVTTPEDEPIVAIPVLPLVHVPPVVASLSVIVAPWHTLPAPAMAGKEQFMETV